MSLTYPGIDFDTEVARGKYGGNMYFERKFGENEDVQSTAETVWAYSGAHTFPTTAATIDVVSSLTTDAAAGAGARTLYIEGLNTNWETASEVVTLNGTTTVTTTGTYNRVQRAFVTTVGTYGGSNLGNITLTMTGGTVQAYIPIGFGQTAQVIYTVPAGWTAFVKQIRLASETGKSTDFHYKIRLNADNQTTIAPVRVFGHTHGVAGVVVLDLDHAPVLLPEKTDVWIEADQATGTASVSAAVDFLLIRNRV